MLEAVGARARGDRRAGDGAPGARQRRVRGAGPARRHRGPGGRGRAGPHRPQSRSRAARRVGRGRRLSGLRRDGAHQVLARLGGAGLPAAAAEHGAAERILLGGDVARRTRYVAYGGMPGLAYLGDRFRAPAGRGRRRPNWSSGCWSANPARWLARTVDRRSRRRAGRHAAAGAGCIVETVPMATSDGGNLLHEISSKLPYMAPAMRQIAELVLSDPERIRTMSITELAAAAERGGFDGVPVRPGNGPGQLPVAAARRCRGHLRQPGQRRRPPEQQYVYEGISRDEPAESIIGKVERSSLEALRQTALRSTRRRSRVRSS